MGVPPIERNAQGKSIPITDHKSRSVGYVWENQGVPKERVYTDGTTIWWAYRTCGELMALIHEEGMG